METKPNGVEELFQKLKDYVEVRLELLKLKSINKAAGFMPASITILVLIIISSVVLLCFTVGAALLIGELMGKSYFGFFVMGGLYLIIGLIFYSMRHKLIKTRIINKLIKELID
jgi:membrane-bound ClpP family serine protease